MRSASRGRVSNPQAYIGASKNMRRFAGVDADGALSSDSRNILQQGLITGGEQNIKNVEQIIKYLQGDRFRKWIESEIKNALSSHAFGEDGAPAAMTEFDDTSIWQQINSINAWIRNHRDPDAQDISADTLTLTVNGSEEAVSGNPFNPLSGEDQTIDIDLSSLMPENPFYPMKYQTFEANTPNGITEYGSLEAGTQVILIKKMLANANGIKLTNINKGANNERFLFVQMAGDSPFATNVTCQFLGAPPPNINLQQAAIVLINGDYAMYQQVSGGGAMS